MAIQQINLGSMPLGAGGDTQRAANEKINQNFSNSTHAASRLVGVEAGNVMEVGAFGLGAGSSKFLQAANPAVQATNEQLSVVRMVGFSDVSQVNYGAGINFPTLSNRTHQIIGGTYADFLYHVSIDDRSKPGSERVVKYSTIYTSGNTTREAGTGYIKASSPVLNLLHNDFEKIHEAEQLDIKVENPKTGVYKISGTTGLRKNDGWYFSPPKDEHNNVLCMVEVEEDGDVVTVKTYKKKFDFETVSIVPDYDNPTDIPEGAIVMLRFNDLPQELINEPIE